MTVLRFLFSYGVRVFDALVILLIMVLGAAAGYRLLRRQWQLERERLAAALTDREAQVSALQRDLAEVQARCDPGRLKALREELQSAVAHEFVRGLNSMLQRCQETLAGLPAEAIGLRDRQSQSIAQGYELLQHAQNIVGLSGLQGEPLQRELVSPRALLEGVLKELFPYAEVQGVILRPNLASLEPVQANRHLVAQVCANVIHNAIKYSRRGSAVDVDLRLEAGVAKRIVIEVRDRGRGISEKEQERLFTPRRRADGLVEPGSGLGLYYSRELARLHGGDLVLVESRPNEGTTFRIVLPY